MGFCARGPSEIEQRAARKLDYSALSSRLCLLRQTFFLRETNHTSTKPPRLLLVCVSVGLTPLLGMRGIFRVRYWKFTSLCRWTLQPGNIRSDPIRQNKSCSPVPRELGGGGGSQMERSGMPVVRTRNWIRRTRNSSLKTELKAFFNCYLLQRTIKDTLTAKNSSVFSRTP